MERILIVPIGAVDRNILRTVAQAVHEAFQCEAQSAEELTIPREAYNKRRGQYHSTTMLKELLHSKPNDVDRILGVVDADLYVSGLNFVFGEADVSHGTAVIALARLKQEFYGLRPNKDLFRARAIKEAVHELGHTYGLGHCPDPTCIMHFSNTLGDTDLKGPEFCNTCRRRPGPGN